MFNILIQNLPLDGEERGVTLRILNLGAGGFIGAHLTHRLLDEGHTITAVDTHNDKILDILGHPHFMYVERDIRHMEFQLDGLVKEADLILVMESAHKAYFRRMWPQAKKKVFLLKEYGDNGRLEDVDDPIGLGRNVYRKCRDEIAAEIDRLLPALLNELKIR